MTSITLTYHGGGARVVPLPVVDVRTHPEGGATVVGHYGSVRVRESRDYVMRMIAERKAA